MGDTIVSGCLQHKDTRYIQVRCDYLELYKGNEHKAKIIRILEGWTDFKRTEWYKDNLDRIEQGQEVTEPDFWVTMSHQQFRQFMYATSSLDTIKSNIAELVSKDKHVERRINPDNPYGPPQYRIIVGSIQKGLNKLGTPPLMPELPSQEEDTPPGETTPPPGVNNTPTQRGNIPPPSLENSPLGEGGKTATSKNRDTKITENITQNNEESTMGDTPAAFDANASPPSPSLQEKGVNHLTDGIKMVDKPQTPSQETQQSSYSQQQEPEAIGDKQSSKQETLLEAPLSEPSMDGAWVAEKVVQYAEWRNQKRYTDKMRTGQLEAARFFHRDDPHMTLEQFKQGYDDWFPWWQEHKKGPLHVSDLKVKQKNGVVRLYAALERVEAEKKRAQFQVLKPTSTPQLSSVQQQLQKAAGPDFQVLSPVQLLKYSPEERKAYNNRLREHLGRNRQAAAQ